MGLSKLSEACKKCPNVDSCDHKRMEALGCLPSPEPSKAAEIRIDGMSLSSDLYKSLGKQLSSALACGYLKGECKNFFGTSGSNGSKSADVYFNEWIKAHQDIDILEFRYQQARYGDHSICILYEEDSNYD